MPPSDSSHAGSRPDATAAIASTPIAAPASVRARRTAGRTCEVARITTSAVACSANTIDFDQPASGARIAHTTPASVSANTAP